MYYDIKTALTQRIYITMSGQICKNMSADLTIRIKRVPAVWQALIKTDQNLTYLKCQMSSRKIQLLTVIVFSVPLQINFNQTLSPNKCNCFDNF